MGIFISSKLSLLLCFIFSILLAFSARVGAESEIERDQLHIENGSERDIDSKALISEWSNVIVNGSEDGSIKKGEF